MSPAPSADGPADHTATVAVSSAQPAGFTPRQTRLRGRVIARTVWLASRLLAITLRLRWDDRSSLLGRERSERLIFAIWHSQLAIPLILYRRHGPVRLPQPYTAALVSASRDGGLLARILELFNLHAIRGSSSRRGAQALRELVRAAKTGYDLVITPDGPRGPCHVVQDGVIAAAMLSGLRIIPMTYRAGWKFSLRTWDRFQIPLPFSRIDIHVGKPIQVERDLDEAGRERLCRQLEQYLRAASRDEGPA